MHSTTRETLPALRLQPAAQLPPMGPPWWGAVMGSGILANLLQGYTGATTLGHITATVVLVVAWTVMLCWIAAFVGRAVRSSGVLSDSLQGVGVSAWGMVSMGLLSVGSATMSIVPSWSESHVPLDIVIIINALLWTVGTVLGLAVAFGFTISLLRHRPDEPRPAWALAVVPPMVSATTGTALDKLLPTELATALLTCLMGCFCVTLTLAFIVLYAALDHHLRIAAIPTQLAVTSFIPLGPVGQSTAAAQAIAERASHMLLPAAVPTVHVFANLYGSLMMLASVPLTLLAIRAVVRAVRDGMTFTPTWWASTFPIGTVALGALYMSQQPGFEWLRAYGALHLAILCFTWAVSFAATLRALAAHKQ